MKSHKDLDVWKRAIELVTIIYDVTKKFPKDEIYGISNQIRRAAVSIPSNIAEGAARKHAKEFVQFLYVSLGSSSEIETQLLICKNLKYLSDDVLENIQKELDAIRKMIIGLIRSLEIKL
jgi:four helix bundle protein